MSLNMRTTVNFSITLVSAIRRVINRKLNCKLFVLVKHRGILYETTFDLNILYINVLYNKKEKL